MSNIAIRVENLSKLYRIGQYVSYNNFRDSITKAVLAPFRRSRSTAGSAGVESRNSDSEYIWALKGVSFEVERGELVGIIGRNGSGKSTLLKILSRITDPTEGYAEIHGRVGSLLEVGSGFHPELTGRENVYMNGAILGMKKKEIDRKFDEIVEFADVARFIDTPLKRYSSGMQVRLAFAVAAHLEPEILLVDEVLAVGDAAFQKKCLGKMGDVSKEGHTVLLVSHNMTAIESLCQRGILLKNGRAVMDDAVDRTLAYYTSSTLEYRIARDGYISLDEHPGRDKPQEGPVRLAHCRFLNKGLIPVECFGSGDESIVEIGYQITSPLENAELEFLVTFSTLLQQRIFTCSNKYVGQDFKALSNGGEIQCVIPKLPLVPGNYVIHLGCRVNRNWSDGVYDAAGFEVITGDFFGTKLLPPAKGGNALVEHYWVAGSDLSRRLDCQPPKPG